MADDVVGKGPGVGNYAKDDHSGVQGHQKPTAVEPAGKTGERPGCVNGRRYTFLGEVVLW